MLLRMYRRWAERSGLAASLIDQAPGQSVGVARATLELRGAYAYGRLRGEAGVHRLTRRSPFGAAGARLTCFALVEVLPEADDAPELSLRPEDLRIHTLLLAGQAGGAPTSVIQAVYRAGSPEQTAAICQSARPQRQNHEAALRVLRGRLLERALRRAQPGRPSADPVRSYTLHPAALVKDHRSAHTTGDLEAVFDGDLDGLIAAYLRWRSG